MKKEEITIKQWAEYYEVRNNIDIKFAEWIARNHYVLYNEEANGVHVWHNEENQYTTSELFTEYFLENPPKAIIFNKTEIENSRYKFKVANLKSQIKNLKNKNKKIKLLFKTLKNNSIDNKNTINNVDLFIKSWKREFKN
jgi:hypothetical protein